MTFCSFIPNNGSTRHSGSMDQGIFTIKPVKLHFQSPSPTWTLSLTLYLFLFSFPLYSFSESPRHCTRWSPMPWVGKIACLCCVISSSPECLKGRGGGQQHTRLGWASLSFIFILLLMAQYFMPCFSSHCHTVILTSHQHCTLLQGECWIRLHLHPQQLAQQR